MIHQPVSVVSQCGADAWLNRLASWDQRRLTGSGSASEACSRRCAIQIHGYFTYFIIAIVVLCVLERCGGGMLDAAGGHNMARCCWCWWWCSVVKAYQRKTTTSIVEQRQWPPASLSYNDPSVYSAPLQSASLSLTAFPLASYYFRPRTASDETARLLVTVPSLIPPI